MRGSGRSGSVPELGDSFLGTALGHHGVNVASVHLGKSSAGQALSVWNLDDELPHKALAEVRASANVLRAVAIEL